MAKKKTPSKKSAADRTVSSESPKMESLKNFVRSRGVDYLRDPNISSVGIGYKIKDGKMTNEISVQFTVNQKSQPEMLESVGTHLIPASFEIDGMIVPTDVLERTYEASFNVVAEAAATIATIDASGAAGGARWVRGCGTFVGIDVKPIRDPLPDVTSHVVEPKRRASVRKAADR